MRNTLLASIAMLGSGAIAGAAVAQTPADQPVGAPTQGQVMYRAANPTGTVNENNNLQAKVIRGPLVNPQPGTIVIHINGKVFVQGQAMWTSADQRLATTAPTGSVKLAPQAIDTYAREYFGADGMASNGLRYGAAIELRENFTGQISNNTSSGASGYTSLETVFVRRAFTYLAGDQWGIVRIGQADGIIGIFDNGVTTFQFLPTGNLEGGDLQSNVPQNASVPWLFLSLAGNEYGNTKIVYLSPQVAGFDLGIQYAPNTSNGFGISGTAGGLSSGLTGSGVGTGINCTAANTGCPSLSSSPGIQDGSRILNQTAVGIRYQGVLGGVGVLAYGAYEFSGTANYTGPTTPDVLGNTGTLAASTLNGKYDGLSFGNAGLASTYAGFTVGGNVIGGRVNGALASVPQHGTSEFAYTIGAKYVNGPFTIGVVGEIGWFQGNVNLTGISQRRGRGLDFGASYAVAPGFIAYAEYVYQDLQQSGFNFITGTAGGAGGGLNNNIKAQGFAIGNLITF
jgi:hypothetical protein